MTETTAQLRVTVLNPGHWHAITGAGQVVEGDRVRFTIGDESFEETVARVLHPDTDAEEVIYDQRRNHYFITRCVLDGFSNHKGVQFMPRRRVVTVARPADDA